MDSVTIDRHFCGPQDSGNGGYVCGALAQFIDGPAEMTLRAPPPLDKELTVRRTDDSVMLMDGEQIVAEGRAISAIDLEVPRPPSNDAATAAVQRYLDDVASNRPFPNCFVCGPKRAAGQGLRLFTGPVTGQDIVASHWIPEEALADESGIVKSIFVWAALDCPGFFALWGVGSRQILTVLGRLAVEIRGPVRAGRLHTVIGWAIRHAGRKHYVGTAIYTQSGDLAAVARATWIEVPESVWSDLIKP